MPKLIIEYSDQNFISNIGYTIQLLNAHTILRGALPALSNFMWNYLICFFFQICKLYQKPILINNFFVSLITSIHFIYVSNRRSLSPLSWSPIPFPSFCQGSIPCSQTTRKVPDFYFSVRWYRNVAPRKKPRKKY